MIIWITGLSAAGKSTLARGVADRLKGSKLTINLDGDLIRELFFNHLGYDKQDRIEQIKRIQNLAQLYYDSEVVVIVSAVYYDEDIDRLNRLMFNRYFLVFLKATPDLLKSRDRKGIYSGNSDLGSVVGIDIPYNEPMSADLVIDINKNYNVQEMVDEVIKLVG
jgi:adenylylsulfate kinase-like enzyme